MRNITVNINGTSYPCYPTAGAMLRFRQVTGREVSEMEPGFTDMVTYLWCCIRSASRREGRDMPMELQDFADSLSIEELGLWQKALEHDAGAGDGEGEKKSL